MVLVLEVALRGEVEEVDLVADDFGALPAPAFGGDVRDGPLVVVEMPPGPRRGCLDEVLAVDLGLPVKTVAAM